MYPTNDYVFRRIFGSEGNENITKEFLNTILSQKVTEVRLDSNPILPRDFKDDKESNLDIKAVLDENGIKKLCNIEMQVRNEHNMQQRLPYYWAKLYSSQLKSGEDYIKLCKTICILIADFEFDEKDTDFISEYGILKKRSKLGDRLLTDDLEMYIIELPKLRKKLEKGEEIENVKLVSWLRVISNPNEVEEKDMKENEALKEVLAVLEDINASEYEKDLAERQLDMIRRKNGLKNWGRNIGKKFATFQVAKKMLNANEPTDKIIEFTGLTKEELERIDKVENIEILEEFKDMND